MKRTADEVDNLLKSMSIRNLCKFLYDTETKLKLRVASGESGKPIRNAKNKRNRIRKELLERLRAWDQGSLEEKEITYSAILEEELLSKEI